MAGEKSRIERLKSAIVEWMSGILGVPFTVRDVPYKKLTTDETNKLTRSAKLIDNILKKPSLKEIQIIEIP